MQRNKIGIALGGGAARGWAHIGVLKALDEKRLQTLIKEAVAGLDGASADPVLTETRRNLYDGITQDELAQLEQQGTQSLPANLRPQGGLAGLPWGPIAGTLVFAVLNVADRYSPRRVFLACALLGAAAATVLFSLNLLRSRTGRAWRAIHGREAVAGALGIDVRRAKLSAFVISSMLTAVAGCLFAYFRGFVSVEAFSLFLTIQYVAMIIIGGMGSILGALLGTVFVTLFPYLIEWLMQALGLVEMLAAVIFAVNYSAFGLMMILFLVFEAQGLVGIWRRVQAWLLLWPFRHKPLGEAR